MTPRAGFYRRLGKRVFDLCSATLLAPLLLPLGAFVALLVRIDLGSPVFFSQQRIGRNGNSFTIRKFRTMGDQRREDGRLAPDAERLSRLGSILRRTSLDEIPEFLNILRGEMSIVGPRPLLPRYLPRYSQRQARRHEVRPGLTGLSQVCGRNALTWEEKLDFDVEYVERMSLLLDISILVRTVWVFISGQGISAPGHATMPEFMGESSLDEISHDPSTDSDSSGQ
jgi:lipopolysaccharide/colanic/teichoic acid biosynthesis glycosyltransferase